MHPKDLVGEFVRLQHRGAMLEGLCTGFDPERKQPRGRRAEPAYLIETGGRLRWVPLSEIGAEVLIVKRLAAVWSG